MTDLVRLGFRADSSEIRSARGDMDSLTAAGGRLDRQGAALTRTLGLVGAAIASFASFNAVKSTIFSFDEAMTGLSATTRATTEQMASFEKQARSLGATSKFSATEAANAQRFLAMAGFETNQILSATPEILKLATAAEIDLATAADLASNALGGMQLPVDQLGRVIDVMAETAASANTNISQLASALNNAAPIATAAGVEIEELSAIIGSLSDNGVQAEKAGTGVLGIIRQLSNITPEAIGILDKYGITSEQVSIKQHGLTAVLKTLGAANISAGDAIKIFGSEAATAGLIAASSADKIATMTERYKGAEGAATKMAAVMGGSLVAAQLSLNSAIDEFILKIGDAGARDAFAESLVSITGVVRDAGENIEALGDAGMAMATVYGGALTLSLGRSASATIASAVARQAELVATANSTKAAVSNSAAEIANLKIQQQALASRIANIQSESIRNTLRAQLTKTTVALSAAEALHTRNLVAASTAQTAAAITARGLGAAWRFMLGPVGLAITALGAAAVAFNTTKDSMDLASESAEEHTKKIAELERVYSAWSKSRLEDERNKLLERSNEILFERMDIQEKINKLSENATMQMGMETIVDPKVLAQINELNSQMEKLSAENKEVDESLKPVMKILSDLYPVLGLAAEKTTDLTVGVDKAAQASQKMAESFAKQLLSLENQRQELALTSNEFEIYMVMQQASAEKWTPEMTKVIVDQTRALQAQREGIKAVNLELDGLMGGELFSFDTSMSDDMQSLINDVDNFGGAWERTGNTIVDTFGGIADALGDYTKRIDELDSLQSKIDKEREKSGADDVALNKLQMKVNDERASAEIDNYQSMAGAAASMFSEKTAAAKAFTAINQVLALTEIAISIQKMTTSTAETGVVVANEGVKQVALATTAVANQGSGDPYTAFFRMAAMSALMVGLVSGFGGLSGGSAIVDPTEDLQANQSTGTLLGSDEKSASILNSQERFNDLQVDQLKELRGIRSSMSALSNGIANLAKSFAVSAGNLEFGGALGESEFKLPSLIDKLPSFVDPVLSMINGLIGGFSSTKKEVIDNGIQFMSQTLGDIIDQGIVNADAYFTIKTTKKKFWGASKSEKVGDETQDLGGTIQSQMADIFGFIGDTVVESAALLGFGAEEQLRKILGNFAINIGKVSFEGLSGEEIEAELQAIFSTQADLITSVLVPAMEKYQQMGEGLFDTLTRVTYEQSIFNSQIEKLGFDLSKLSNTIQIDVAQSIIDLIGGLENFSELTNSYVENFFSEQEQFDMLEKSLTGAFESLGLGMVGTREQFKELVEGLDLTTDSGRAMFAALMELNPAMADYFDELEKETQAKEDAAAALAADKWNVELRLLKAQGESTQLLALQRQAEIDASDESLHSMLRMIYALEDAATAEALRAKELAAAEQLAEQGKSLTIRLLQAQGESEKALALQREMELASTDVSLRDMLLSIYAIEDAAKSLTDETAKLDSLKALSNELGGVSDSLNAMIYGAYDAIEASSIKLDSALELARRGDFSQVAGLNESSITSSLGSYDSASEYNYARDVAFTKLAEIRDLSESAEDVTQRAILSIDSSASNINDSLFNQGASIDSIAATNISTDNTMLELVKELKADKKRAQNEAAELKLLLEKMNKESVAGNKILKRIERNAQYIIPTE